MPRQPLFGFLPAAMSAAVCILISGIAVQGVAAQDVDRVRRPAGAAEVPIVPGARGIVPTRETMVIQIGREGRVTQGSNQLSIDALKKALVAFAAKYPDETRKDGERQISRSQILLQLHPELPYEVLYRVMQLCAAPEVSIYRLFASVRATKDGPPAALPIFLPPAVHPADSSDPKKRPQTGFVLALRYARPPMEPAVLEDQLRAARIGFAKTTGRKVMTPLALVIRPEMHARVGSFLSATLSARSGSFSDLRFARGSAIGYPAWDEGKHDLAAIVAHARKPPASAPGAELSGPIDLRTGNRSTAEELTPIASAKPRKGETFNTAIGLGGKAMGKYGNRRRPPTGKDVAAKVAIDLALAWLAKHQDDDGKWDCDAFMKHDRGTAATDGPGNPVHDVGVTGLALLAFLGDGNTLRSGPHKDVVKRGIKWLREQQGPNGLFGTAASHDFLYDHAIATVAMCEAYGLSQYRTLKKTAQAGINYLESHRNPYAVWRYQPRDNDNDLSLTSWCLLACKSAADFGLHTNRAVFKIGQNFLDELTDPGTGRCGYTKRGERSSRHPGNHATRFPPDKGEALTAAGLFLRFILGQNPEDQPIMKLAADTIAAKPPAWTLDGSIDFYYWYYGSYAMYQMGGKAWKNWQAALSPALLKSQRRDANFAGSWDPVGVWCEDGGRIYSTAMSALSLEAVFRYSRLIREKKNK